VVSGIRRTNDVNPRRVRLELGWVTGLRASKPSRRATRTCRSQSTLHPSGVAKSSTSFGWGKGENVASAGWHVTLCDPICPFGTRVPVPVRPVANAILRSPLPLPYLTV